MEDGISIIVPVYNVVSYLEKCLDSILKQTYKNIEIVCVDDGSTDGSGELLDHMAKMDERIIVLHQKNKGTGAARNLALEHVSGKYIGFVDADDWIEPEMYETLHQVISASCADIVTCGFYIEKEGVSYQVYNKKKVENKVLKTEDFLKYIYCRDVYKGVSGYLWTRLFKAELFLATEKWGKIFFQEDLNVGQDVAVIADCCVRAESMIYIEAPFYHYVQRGDSAVHSPKKMMEGKTSCEAYEYIIKLYEEHNISRRTINYVKRFYVYFASIRYQYAREHGYVEKAIEAQNMIKKYLKEYIWMNKQHPGRIYEIIQLILKK